MAIATPGIKVILLVTAFILAILVYYSITQVKRVASAYVYGYPLVLMEKTRLTMVKDDTVSNRFIHNNVFPDHSFRNVVRPNVDTLYSIAWLDLSTAAQVLTVPDTQGRYYVMPLMDAWTNVFATVGKRSTGTGAGSYLITGPDWQGAVPEGVTHIGSPTNMVWIIGRIQTNGKQDIPAVASLQQQFTLASLEQWQQGVARPALAASSDAAKSSVDPAEQVDSMSAAQFLGNLATLLDKQYPAKEDAPALDNLAKLGVEPGSAFDPDQLGWFDSYLSNLALDVTRKAILKQVDEGRSLENGWAVVRDSIGAYGTDYGLRAAVAMIGLGALPPAEASYPNTSVDANGRGLSGQYQYQLHFDAGQTPPVKAFWSLTMYDEDGFLIDNVIERYAIGDRDVLQYNDDGSLDILIQHQQPAAGNSNWLPAPNAPFALTMRIYYPEPSFLDGSWTIPAVQRRDEP